jgi:hypothetical protein
MQDDDRPAEFWQEEQRQQARESRGLALRWAFTFILMFSIAAFALWWAASTVHFGASRSEGSTTPTYRVFGVVTDRLTGNPVPFARVADDPGGSPPLFETATDHLGHYELLTIAERHRLRVSALGYRMQTIEVGKPWYSWMPSGSEVRSIVLERE